MKSYKQIVELLEDIEEKHLILQSFHAGPLDQVDIAKTRATRLSAFVLRDNGGNDR